MTTPFSTTPRPPSRQEVADAIQTLVDLLDFLSDDPDLEPETDACEAGDDRIDSEPGQVGDPTDAEEDDYLELEDFQ